MGHCAQPHIPLSSQEGTPDKKKEFRSLSLFTPQVNREEEEVVQLRQPTLCSAIGCI